MIDVLLISSSLDNINVAWRHFCYSDYNASATTNHDAAMENLRSKKPAQIVVYYCGEETTDFFSFYKALRDDQKTENVPLVVLADLNRQKLLTDYVKLRNACVLGISVNDDKLRDTVKTGARNGFEKRPPAHGRPAPDRPVSRLDKRLPRR
ncbi:MAG: hypothetical protein NC394_09045 [Bacteroides sp.]|nr:hypothetical protein [Bacteroides sp.]